MGISYQGTFSNSWDQVYRPVASTLILNVFYSVGQRDGLSTPPVPPCSDRLHFLPVFPVQCASSGTLLPLPEAVFFFLLPFMSGLSMLAVSASPPALSHFYWLRPNSSQEVRPGWPNPMAVLPFSYCVASQEYSGWLPPPWNIFLPWWYNTLLAFQQPPWPPSDFFVGLWIMENTRFTTRPDCLLPLFFSKPISPMPGGSNCPIIHCEFFLQLRFLFQVQAGVTTNYLLSFST